MPSDFINLSQLGPGSLPSKLSNLGPGGLGDLGTHALVDPNGGSETPRRLSLSAAQDNPSSCSPAQGQWWRRGWRRQDFPAGVRQFPAFLSPNHQQKYVDPGTQSPRRIWLQRGRKTWKSDQWKTSVPLEPCYSRCGLSVDQQHRGTR